VQPAVCVLQGGGDAALARVFDFENEFQARKAKPHFTISEWQKK
jgi:hypothetical protein